MYAKFNRPDPMRDWDWLRPHTLNLYEYVGNDPVNKWDPTGLFELDEKTAEKYPKTANLLRNIAQTFQQKSSEFKEAFKEFSFMNDSQISEALTYGTGPKIMIGNFVLDTNGDGVGDFSQFNAQTQTLKDQTSGLLKNGNGGKGLILLQAPVANMLEKAITDIESLAGTVMIESTVLHETHM